MNQGTMKHINVQYKMILCSPQKIIGNTSDNDIGIFLTHRTPLEAGLFGHAKNRTAGKYRDNPAFHDILK